MKSSRLEIKNGKILETINDFLSSLLEKNLLDALLVPLELPSGNMISLTLVSDSRKIRNANALAPVMLSNGAKTVSRLTKISSSQKKIGVVLRACELRAVIELVKLKQLSLENIILIEIDCFGTYSASTYSKFCQETSSPTDEFLKRIKQGTDPYLREACQVCIDPVSPGADLIIELIGMDLEQAITIKAASPEGDNILDVLGFEQDNNKSKRKDTLAKIIELRTKNRDKLHSRFQKDVGNLDKLLAIFASCTGCHNCRIACPICYCRECLFDSPTFEWNAEDYLKQTNTKGALKMPADNLLYHLTRLYHIGASCISCGFCQDACPNDIPLFPIFSMTGSQVQKTFDYVPGRSLEENLPLSVFDENEFGEIE